MVNLIPKKVLRLFDYRPKTGILYWQPRPLSDFKRGQDWKRWNNRFAYTKAGYKNSSGYIIVCIDGVQYLAHRIIAYIMKGWNKIDMHIDHKNGIKSDNRWKNLRPATNSQNMCNRGCTVHNSTRYKGSYWVKGKEKFKSSIKEDGRTQHLGYFDTAQDAHRAYVKAAKKLHGKFYKD